VTSPPLPERRLRHPVEVPFFVFMVVFLLKRQVFQSPAIERKEHVS